jgi:hypothetical protein
MKPLSFFFFFLISQPMGQEIHGQVMGRLDLSGRGGMSQGDLLSVLWGLISVLFRPVLSFYYK